ncbi:hypothetical protein [Altericroceibacterium xinjiangense]|uniref:hypothetical protein n=1 Tax=Altericroceibacterium xinjiangense TaxID=762261 RepID=UPI000F7E5AE3|nr:hypothetical protein [Altericroceibacterium xinjiangense]
MTRSLAVLALALAPVPALAGEAEGYRCVAESRINTSLGQNLPVDKDGKTFHPASDLQADGPHLTRREVTMNGDSESQTTHRIDPATGEYHATTYLTDHRMGEQYVLETSGTCVLSSGKAD